MKDLKFKYSRSVRASIVLISICCALPLSAIECSELEHCRNRTTTFTAGDFIKLTAGDFRYITGQRLSLREKIGFWLVKRKIRKAIRRGEIPSDMPVKGVPQGTFNFGAFMLGFFLNLLGILIVVFAFKDKQAWESAIIGFAALVGVGVIIFFASLASLV